MDILIKFRHGLGDAVQLTSVLKHLEHYHPDWNVDVAALAGKHSAFRGLCRKAHVLQRDRPDEANYDRVLNLDWPECATCYTGWPGTKAERALLEVFDLKPVAQLCRYEIHPGPEATELARAYLEGTCGVAPGPDGRYPVVLIHYEGNTSAESKNLPTDLVRRLCGDILAAGAVPIILDWDARSPLPDGKRIYCPHAQVELWGGMGTGDAERLAALIELGRLMIGVDSGPLHVAGATSTPTIGVWTRHHPLHYFGLADHVTHLVPENHAELLRGSRQVGEAYFAANYRYAAYEDLERTLRHAVRDRLQQASGGLVFTRNFWVRSDNVEQDLVIVRDVAEDDAYRIADLPLPRPVVVDVGAHIGTFAKRVHDVCPLARIIAVECCPENIPALEHNVGQFATIVQAAVTYEQDVALMSSVYPHCTSTGGCAVRKREELQRCVDGGRMHTTPGPGTDSEFWVDLRPLQTVTLEEILEEHGLERIDVLKLDCETSEFSILRNTKLLDRIGVIVGEFHGKEKFLRLVEERFAGWTLKILKDADVGLFRLTRPERAAVQTGPIVPPQARLRRLSVPLLVSTKRTHPEEVSELLVLLDGRIQATLAHSQARFARHGNRIWCIDAAGALSQVDFEGGKIRLQQVSQSPLAVDGHSLAVTNGKLLIAGTEQDAVVEYDPATDQWTAYRPFPGAVTTDSDGKSIPATDRYHLNEVLADGEGYLLSMFTTTPRPAGSRWRDTKSDGGVIVRWGRQGFGEAPLATDLYGPHSLVRFDSRLWWCDSFRRQVCREDGWRSPCLEGFTRGLAFVDGHAVVGLSRSRVDPHPRSDVCGISVFDLADPEARYTDPLPAEYTEIYDVLPLEEGEFLPKEPKP